MLWFILHRIFQLLPSSVEQKTRDFTTFLIGTILYATLYSYFKTYNPESLFLTCFLNFTMYIVIADAFVMAVIYKNHHNKNIFTEMTEIVSNIDVNEKELKE